MAWVKQRSDRGTSEQASGVCIYPLEYRTFQKLFGNWEQTLRAAHPNISAEKQERQKPLPPPRTVLADRPVPRDRSNREGQHITRAHYETWRKQKLRQDPNFNAPSSHKFVRHFGTWRQALGLAAFVT